MNLNLVGAGHVGVRRARLGKRQHGTRAGARRRAASRCAGTSSCWAGRGDGGHYKQGTTSACKAAGGRRGGASTARSGRRLYIQQRRRGEGGREGGREGRRWASCPTDTYRQRTGASWQPNGVTVTRQMQEQRGGRGRQPARCPQRRGGECRGTWEAEHGRRGPTGTRQPGGE